MNAAPKRQGGRGFAPGAGGAAGRGIALIAVAVVIGLVLLWRGLDGNDNDVSVSTDGTDVATDTAGSETGGTDTSAVDAGATDGTDASVDGTDATVDGSVVDGGTGSTPSVPTGVTTPPASLIVLVANGSDGTFEGAAGKVTDRLRTFNYNLLEAANANPTDTSYIYYKPGFEQDALALATSLGVAADVVLAAPTAIPVPANATERATQANVIVVIGKDGKIPVT